jgi:hypothetical protein
MIQKGMDLQSTAITTQPPLLKKDATGFEPVIQKCMFAFKTNALNHSATHPIRREGNRTLIYGFGIQYITIIILFLGLKGVEPL